MNNPADDIMSVYGEKCKGIYVPNPEQEFKEKCKVEKNDVLNKYFSRSPQKQESVQETVQPSTQSQESNVQVLTEKQQRNQILFEAANMVNKVLPYFEDLKDKQYVNQIKEALEELID